MSKCTAQGLCRANWCVQETLVHVSMVLVATKDSLHIQEQGFLHMHMLKHNCFLHNDIHVRIYANKRKVDMCFTQFHT